MHIINSAWEKTSSQIFKLFLKWKYLVHMLFSRLNWTWSCFSSMINVKEENWVLFWCPFVLIEGVSVLMLQLSDISTGTQLTSHSQECHVVMLQVDRRGRATVGEPGRTQRTSIGTAAGTSRPPSRPWTVRPTVRRWARPALTRALRHAQGAVWVPTVFRVIVTYSKGSWLPHL